MEIRVSTPPPSGVWRVGRDPDPLAASKSGGSSEVLKPGTGNRFDSPSGNFGVRYFATSLDGCFGETLARFRPDPLLSKVIGDDLDVALVRGRDRRVTRYVSQWVFEQGDEDGNPLYAGIRYLSRLNTEWECWAVFDDVEIEERERRPIRSDDRSYKEIAKLYGLTPN